jgi:hypothetical protein
MHAGRQALGFGNPRTIPTPEARSRRRIMMCRCKRTSCGQLMYRTADVCRINHLGLPALLHVCGGSPAVTYSAVVAVVARCYNNFLGSPLLSHIKRYSVQTRH